MTTAPFIPLKIEVRKLATDGDYLLPHIFRDRAVPVRVPVVTDPNQLQRKYNDSELATAASMLVKLRNGADRSAPIDVENEALDVVVEKLMELLR